MLDSSLSGISKGGILVPRHDRISRQRWTIRLSLSRSLFFRSMKKKKKESTRLIAVNTGSSSSFLFLHFVFYARFFLFLFSFSNFFFPCIARLSAFYFFRRLSPFSFIRFSGFRVLIFVVCIRGKNEGWNIGQGGMAPWNAWNVGRIEGLVGVIGPGVISIFIPSFVIGRCSRRICCAK